MSLFKPFIGAATRLLLDRPAGQSTVPGVKLNVTGDKGEYYVKVITDGSNPNHGKKGEIESLGFAETSGNPFGNGDGMAYVSDKTPFSRFELTEVSGTHELKISSYIFHGGKEKLHSERSVMRYEDRLEKIRTMRDAGLPDAPRPGGGMLG